MQKPAINPEERIVSLSDVKQLYISIRKRLFKWAFLGALLTFLAVGIQRSKYKGEACFKAGTEKGNHETLLTGLIGGGFLANQPEAGSIMRSFRVLKPLIEKLGLQVDSPNRDWIGKKLIRRYWETLLAEAGVRLSDRSSFVFENVRYEGEDLFRGAIQFSDPSHFTLYSRDKKKKWGEGSLSSPFLAKKLEFTLIQIPKNIRMGAFYPIQVTPWVEIAKGLSQEIGIKKNKDNGSLINLSFSHRDRQLAAQILNELMDGYRNYLKSEFDEVAQAQLLYLDQKQGQILARMDELSDEYTHFLRESLGTAGYMPSEEGATLVLAPHHAMHRRLMEVELELSLIEKFSGEGKVFPNPNTALLSREMEECKQQRDLLELSLSQFSDDFFKTKQEELKEIRALRCSVEQVIKEIDAGGEISSFDGGAELFLWAHNIRDPEEREDLAQYLENYARLLAMREKMLKERFCSASYPPSELDGMDLHSARQLLLEYNGKLDAAEAAKHHYERLKKEIHQPDFDLASLGGILTDPLCQKVIEDASKLSMQLKDEKHCTSKEVSRWGEELLLQKKILLDQLEQLAKVEELHGALIRQKMNVLQKVSLDCLNQRISVLDEQANEMMKKQRASLFLEKDLLEKKIGETRVHLAEILPDKIRFERSMEMKSEMLNTIMGSVVQVAESKSLSAHLHHVESKPIDYAEIPSLPEKPNLFLLMLCGTVSFPGALFLALFFRQLLKGFPVSGEKLKMLGLPTAGEISSFCDGPFVDHPTGSDLNLLRQLALFAEGSKVISLIGGKGPDYSYALGENLARISKKSIVLRCDFLSKFPKEDVPGILQLSRGEISELPIRKGRGFDYLTSGGYTLFGTEIIRSENFASLIDLLKKEYDALFLLFRSPLHSAESMAALRISDKAIVTLSGETTEELTPFIDWAYHRDSCRLTFITRT